MAVKIPWMLLCVAAVPVIMVWTKALRMDAREMHEIQMRIKYHSEYWEKGNNFSARLREHMAVSLQRTEDPLKGRDVAEITEKELKLAARQMEEACAPPRQQQRMWGLF